MPAGYTASVGEGKITTLRQFALQCARGMGATIMMRDDPFDAPIPERFEPSFKYNEDSLAAARATLAELTKLSTEECEARAEASFAQAMTAHLKYEEEKDAENRRYRDMISAVEAWETHAEGIKEFMLQQLSISVSDYRSEPPIKLSGNDWRDDRLKKAARDIGYHEEEIAKEIIRTEGRNRWLTDLRASLPADSAP